MPFHVMVSAEERMKNLMNKPIVATLATITPEGYPHQVPLWVVEHEDKLYFSTYKSSKKARNLSDNAQVGLSVVDPSGMPYFSIFGEAAIRTKDEVDSRGNTHSLVG